MYDKMYNAFMYSSTFLKAVMKMYNSEETKAHVMKKYHFPKHVDISFMIL